MEIRDPNTGQIKTWVWIVGGVGALVLVYLVMKTMGSSTSSSTGQSSAVDSGGQSSDISAALAALQSEIDDLASKTGVPGPVGPPGPTGPPGDSGNPPPPPPPDVMHYTIKAGDTWNSVATKFGLTLTELYALNPVLKTAGHANMERGGGRVITVPKMPDPTPTPTPITRYTIKAGDTLNSIASKFGLTLTQLKTDNPTLTGFGHPDVSRGGGKTISVVGTSNVH